MAAAAPLAAESSRSGASADSYIGSLISLTSKCEIRYEGILYNINTEESSIGLRNVRSFGTEGRKKDGPQIPPSDKIYDYILFRGSDIKDLQVKSSPPSAPSIHNDPAIIQSHYPRPTATSASVPSVGGGAIQDLSSHAGQMGIPRPPFQGGLPLYQPGGSLGSWGSSPSPPTADGSGLGLPMYWQGFYPPPGGLPHMQQPPSSGLPHMQQPTLLRPPPGLAIPQSVPQPLQYPGLNASFPSLSQNLSGPVASVSGSTDIIGVNATSSTPSSNLPELPYSLVPPINSVPGPGLSSSSLPSTTAPTQATMLASEKPSTLTQNRTPTLSNTIASVSTAVPPISKVEPVSVSVSSISKPISGPPLSYQPVSQPLPSSISLPTSNPTEITIPSLVTPGQLLQSSSSVVSSSQPLQTVPKEVDVKAAGPEPPKVSPSESKVSPSEPKVSTADCKEPILPTPPNQKGPVLHAPAQHNFRGRGRGRGNGYARPVTKFTEDFDFTSMNEKFNKDEVWGHLGKSKAQTRDVDEDEDDFQDEDYTESLRPETKPVYVKDDFFDSLSCNALDHGNRNGRTRFSEQMKIDTETFGDFHRHRGRGGGRGYRGGSRGRGGYGYGRGGYGYGGRGRGYPAPNRAS